MRVCVCVCVLSTGCTLFDIQSCPPLLVDTHTHTNVRTHVIHLKSWFPHSILSERALKKVRRSEKGREEEEEKRRFKRDDEGGRREARWENEKDDREGWGKEVMKDREKWGKEWEGKGKWGKEVTKDREWWGKERDNGESLGKERDDRQRWEKIRRGEEESGEMISSLLIPSHYSIHPLICPTRAFVLTFRIFHTSRRTFQFPPVSHSPSNIFLFAIGFHTFSHFTFFLSNIFSLYFIQTFISLPYKRIFSLFF